MQKILSLLKSQTIKDTLVIGIGLGATAVIGFIYTVILARVLGPNSFGVYSAISALATIVYSLGDLGITAAIINMLPKKIHPRSAVINTSFWLQSIIIVVAIAFFLFVSIFNKFVIPGSLSTDLLLAGALAVNYLFIGFAQGVFTAERKFWSYSASQVVDSGIKIAIVFAIFKLNRLTIGTAIAANVLSTFLALLITFGSELMRIKLTISRNIYQEIIKFSKWIAVSRLFSVFISRIDIVLLNLLATSYATGIFSAASRVTLLFALMVSGLGSVVNSRFSAFDTKEKVVSYVKKLMLFISGISVLMLTCVILAAPIIGLVYGPEYLEAVPVFQGMTVAMIPFLFSLVTTPAIIYTYNRPDFYAFIVGLQVTLIIALDIALIPRYTYFAPVIALGVANTLVFIISGLKLKSFINGNKILDRG